MNLLFLAILVLLVVITLVVLKKKKPAAAEIQSQDYVEQARREALARRLACVRPLAPASAVARAEMK